MTKSKNDLAWERLFEKYEILKRISEEGFAVINASQINDYREARLMTKFDHKSQLPELFADNNLSILPTSRGGYIIGTFETFHDFNKDDVEVSPVDFPTFLESLDYRDITSEATAVNCAYVSKILQNFTEEEDLWPTVSGRMSSSNFEFDINSAKGLFRIKVGSSQVEIDGGYEGDNSLNLIEAKNYISDDFLVRQLFYPYKLWSDKIHKVVRPVFLTYTNGIFHLREYRFNDAGRYNSLVLVKHRKYRVQEAGFNLEVLLETVERTSSVPEPALPFPQADSFERVINLCELLKQKEFISKEEITENYDFDARQTDYYSNAGRYLGLIDTGRDSDTLQIGCWLSRKGKQVFNLDLNERQKEFVRLISAHTAFRESLKMYIDLGEMPDKERIVEIMKRSGLYNVNSNSTYYRRASTVSGWIAWIVNQIEE